MINPLVSSDELTSLMQGRKMVKMSLIKSHINKKTNDVDDDWVTMGIVVGKDTKVSKNGNQYSLWKLSDLKSENYASLFLFGKSNEKHWKLPLGSVIGLLNATIMSENKEYKGKGKNSELCSLTLNDPDKLLHIGTSKDMGYCKAQRKDGQVCGNLITKAEDEFCLYHIKNAYRKFSSKRPEIQSNFSSKEPDDFYFGNNFTPNVALNQKNIVLELKSTNKQQLAKKRELEGETLKKAISNPISIAARNLSQFTTLQNTPKSTSKPSSFNTPSRALPTNSPSSFKEFFDKLKDRNITSSGGSSQGSASKPSAEKASPMLAKGIKRGATIELDVSSSQMSAAKRRAIEILKNKPLPSATSSKVTPKVSAAAATVVSASAASEKAKKLSNILKRVNSCVLQSNDELRQEQETAERAKAKERAAFIEATMKRTSVNQHLAEQVESELEEQYFGRLEKKERMESRMIEAHSMTAKVVTCTACKYTAFSQSDLCKSKGHEVDFHQAKKRFFSCKSCKTRTYTLNKFMPDKACKGCGGTAFEKAGMIKVSAFICLLWFYIKFLLFTILQDKVETKLGKNLLIRGEEVQFLNSVR